MRSIVLPQAIRNMRPDLISNTLEVIKMTSLASVVAVPELLGNARQAQALTYNPTPISSPPASTWSCCCPSCGF